MGDLDKNIHRREEPYEKIIINPIEKERKEKEPGYTGLGNATKSQTYAALLSYFKKILSSFASRGKATAFDQYDLSEKVRAFRGLLLLLSKEDQSHNPDFTLHLSTLWHSLLEDCNAFSLENPSEMSLKLKFFMGQVQNYPLGADHTLGYYFTEYAGKEWIPFPFMELLQQLHEEFNSDPAHSVLGNWIALLNEILGT
jgi:hypothetical protein